MLDIMYEHMYDHDMSHATHNSASPESKQHDVKKTLTAGESTNATERLWKSLEIAYECYSEVQTGLLEAEKQEEDSLKQLNQLRRSIIKRNDERDKHVFELGKVCFKLRNLYSERAKSGDRSDKSSGHGTYIKELEARGYDRRRAAEWVHDYKAAEKGTPNTAAKRRARRTAKKVEAKSTTLATATGPSTPQRTAAQPIAQDHDEASDAAHKRFFDVHLEGLSDDCGALEDANIPAVVRACLEKDELSGALGSIANVMQRLGNLSSSLRAAADSGLVKDMPPTNNVAELAVAA